MHGGHAYDDGRDDADCWQPQRLRPRPHSRPQMGNDDECGRDGVQRGPNTSDGDDDGGLLG